MKFRFSLQVPCLVVSPQNQHSTKTTEFVRWKEAWVYHFNTEGLNLLDTDFKIVICDNGIHHFTSTKILSTYDQNKAIIKLLSIMGRNMNQLAGNYQGCENVKNFNHHTHQQLTSLEQDPSTKLTPPTSSAGPPPPASEAPASAPPADKYRYHCNQCDKKFQRSNELQAHVTSKHGEGFPCELCDHQPFSSNAALKVHIKQKHGEGTAVNYQCPNCNYTSNRKDAVTAHEVKQHGRKLREDEIVKCPNADKGCTKTFLTMENCKRHVRLICQKQAEVKCQDPTCTRQLKNKNQMLAHYQIHTPEGQKWLCSVCNKQCASQQSYNNHVKRHQKQ